MTEVTVSVDYGGKKGQHVTLNVAEKTHEAIESALEQKLQQEFGSWNIVKSQAFRIGWAVVKEDEPNKCHLCNKGYLFEGDKQEPDEENFWVCSNCDEHFGEGY